MNILDNTTLSNCTSCGVCASVCAKVAIDMELDNNGFYRPMINTDLCVDCGLCTTVCYKYDEDVKMTLSEGLKDKPLYSAWSNDDELVKQTTSGGIGDLLAHQLLKEGYKVVGVVYNEDKTRAEHRVAEGEEDLYGFRGSKYIQSYTYEAFKMVVANCQKEKYAVFGTPCQIYALNKLATKRKVRDNFLFIDLFCHGCPSIFVWTKYQTRIKKKLGIERFDKVIFRSKTKGWGIFKVEVVVDGKPVIINEKSNDNFYELFFSDQVLNEACQDCKLRSTLEYTDIRLGDFWGKKYLNNYKGVSAISLVTTRGWETFDSIKEKITLANCDYQDFLPWQSWGKTYSVNTEIRKAIINSLNNPQENIVDAIRVLRKKLPFINNIMRLAKCTISFLPLQLINTLKRIKYSILK